MGVCPYCRFSPLTAEDAACPRCHAPIEGAASQKATEGTRLESPADVKRWIDAARASESTPKTQVQRREPAIKAAAPDATKAAAPDNDGSQPFRPTSRPPMLVLCLLDQGRDGGEFRRIRGDRAVIGRTQSDIVIEHDPGISGEHAALVRVESDGRLRWWLEDLQSRNGTFARCAEAPLEHEQEFLIGMKRLRFETAEAAESLSGQDRKTTQAWQAVTPADLSRLLPSLVELTPSGPGTRTPLVATEHWIGTDASCAVVVSGDPFVSKRHAKVFRTPQGRWRIKDGSSRNGTWLRVRKVPIDTTAELQIGEQRILVKVC
jgi:pSer/pThr/pTyr-binding forkhead associated (FHA) protein